MYTVFAGYVPGVSLICAKCGMRMPGGIAKARFWAPRIRNCSECCCCSQASNWQRNRRHGQSQAKAMMPQAVVTNTHTHTDQKWRRRLVGSHAQLHNKFYIWWYYLLPVARVVLCVPLYYNTYSVCVWFRMLRWCRHRMFMFCCHRRTHTQQPLNAQTAARIHQWGK